MSFRNFLLCITFLCCQLTTSFAASLPGAITALAYSPDGKRLAVGTYGEVVLYDTSNWQPVSTFTGVEDTARVLAFHPDGHTLAIGCGLPGRSGDVLWWDTTGTAKPRTYIRQRDTVETISFRKDGKAMLIGANDNKARLYNALPAEFGPLLDEHNGRVLASAFSTTPDTVFVTGAMDKLVKVWDSKSRSVVVNFDQAQGGITGLVGLPDGRQFVGSSMDGRLYWWQVNYDEQKHTYSGSHYRTQGAHQGGVLALSISADGKRLISGGENDFVRVWKADDGGRIRDFKDSHQPIYAVALSPDGKIAVGGGRDGSVYIWDVEANKLLSKLVPPAPPEPATPKQASAPAKKKEVVGKKSAARLAN